MHTMSRVSLAGVLAMGLAVPAWAVVFPDQTLVNLFQHYDRTSGTQLVTGTSAQRNPMPLVDAGYSGTQVDGSSARWDFELALDQARAASKLIVDYSGYHPDNFSVYYRAADGDPWTPLIVNETSQQTTHQDHWEWTLPGGASGTPVKTVRFVQDPSTIDNYIRMNEIKLIAAANSTLDDVTAGYNLLANRSALGTITPAMIHSENPAAGLDNDPMTGWIRPYGSPPPSWFVIPLAQAYEIWGVSLGFYDNWGNCYISTSNDLTMPDPTTNGADPTLPPTGWTAAYANNSTQGPAFIKLAAARDARWIRVQFNGGNALSELQLFAAAPYVPEPATLGLLALGALGVLRRRRG